MLDFREGDCPVLAIALHRITGYPLKALIEFDEDRQMDVLIHAYVRMDKNTVIDADGYNTVDNIKDSYPHWGRAFETSITESELFELGYGRTQPPDIELAMQAANEILDNLED